MPIPVGMIGSPRRRLVLTLSTFLLALAACGGESTVDDGSADTTPAEIAMTEEASSDAADTTAPPETVEDDPVAASDTTVVSDDDAPSDTPVETAEPGLSEVDADEGAPTPDQDPVLPRRTAEGIELSLDWEETDFGDGPEPALWVRGERSGLVSGVTVDPTFLVADTATVDTIGWAGSAGVFVVMVETGPTVAEVRLASRLGGTDATGPDGDRLAVLGVVADELDDLSIEAIDGAGAVVGSCVSDGTFLNCTD